jgi:hypothetical protein
VTFVGQLHLIRPGLQQQGKEYFLRRGLPIFLNVGVGAYQEPGTNSTARDPIDDNVKEPMEFN